MNYRIAETRTCQKEIEKPQYRRIYKKITEYVYPLLRRNPYFGPNIKRLKGGYSDFYRYRIGDYRLIYSISDAELILYMITCTHRKDSYT